MLGVGTHLDAREHTDGQLRGGILGKEDGGELVVD
jgi:hypothetical protein